MIVMMAQNDRFEVVANAGAIVFSLPSDENGKVKQANEQASRQA